MQRYKCISERLDTPKFIEFIHLLLSNCTISASVPYFFTFPQHEWLMLLKKENKERQMVKSMARRNYLLKYVLPKVSECLVIYGQRRPADPIDFLVG